MHKPVLPPPTMRKPCLRNPALRSLASRKPASQLPLYENLGHGIGLCINRFCPLRLCKNLVCETGLSLVFSNSVLGWLLRKLLRPPLSPLIVHVI
jgi:hypothetical protein